MTALPAAGPSSSPRAFACSSALTGEIQAALDTAEAWSWNVDTRRARELLDLELRLLWGLHAG